MKILEVIFSLRSGGAEQFVVDLTNEFAASGYQTGILIIRDIRKNVGYDFLLKSLNPAVNVFYLNSRIPSPISVSRLIRLLSDYAPDIVHLHLNVLPYFFLPALFLKCIRFFHTIHNVASVTIGYPGQKMVNKLFYKHKWIQPITISEVCRKTFSEIYHLAQPPCISNGRSIPVKTEQFGNVQKDVQLMKQHPDDCIFIQVASIEPRKNQMLSVKIFSELHRLGIHAILLLLGKKDDVYYQTLQKEMPPNVFYLGEKKNVGDYLNCSDYFLLTSRYEGLPISLLEAIATGCTPICAAVGGIPDVIKDGETGYLVDSESVPVWSEKISSLLSHSRVISPAFLKEYYEKNYTMCHCAENYVKYFSEFGIPSFIRK